MDIVDKFEAEFGNPNKYDFFCRVCSECNKGMNFGWMIGDHTVCSDECAISFLGQEEFDAELKVWDEGGENDNVYFTHWEDLIDATCGDDGYYNSKGELIECEEEDIKKILIQSDYFAYLKERA